MSVITTLRPRLVPSGGIRRLTVAELQRRLAVLQRRLDILDDVLPRWRARGGGAKHNFRELRSEQGRLSKEIRIVRRAIAAAREANGRGEFDELAEQRS